jgi:lipopolysaccharide exporter
MRRKWFAATHRERHLRLLRQIARRLYESHFFRNVLVMMTGTVLAQAIALAFVPVLSRLYSPATYGVFGIYLSIVGIVVCVATLRLDIALVLPKDDADGAGILWLCGIATTATAALTGVLCLTFGPQLSALLKTPELAPWMWSIPLSIFFMSGWQSLTAWSTRRKQFHRASISQVVRALTGPGTQVATGFFGGHVLGLIFGAMTGDLCGSASFATQVLKRDWPLIRGALDKNRLRRLAREYADFPKYTTPQSLLNSASQNVPSLLLAYYFGTAVVGYYAIGVRIVQLPMNLILNSLRSVLYQKTSEVFNHGGDTYALFKKTTLGLIAFVALPTLLIMVLAPTVAAFVLGEEWRTAGAYASWLVLWLAAGFCNLPAVLFGQIYRRQRMLFVVEAALLACRIAAVVLGGLYFTPLQTIIFFSVVGLVYNIFLIAWAWNFLRRQPRGATMPEAADASALSDFD